MAISRFWNQLYSAIVFLLVCGMVSTLSAKPNQKKLPQTGKAILHFRPEGMKAGDVIPFFWKGSYHLFYLKGPDWGHIVSQDLLHWQELPKALVKGADPQGPDWESIWTGSIVEHNGTFFLFYTGKNSNDPLGDQKVMQARSTDLIHWEKHPEYTFYADGKIYWNKTINGAIDNKQIYHHQAFRDPHVVWNPKEKIWWLALHSVSTDGSSPNVGLYTSTDLTRWTPHTPLIIYPNSVSGDCPDVFALDDLWNVNCADYHYMQVDKTGTLNPKIRPYDCGDLRVAKTMYDGKRRILIGWIGDYKDSSDNGSYEWGGSLSMPRELYADENNQLCQRPVKEVLRLFSETKFQAKNVDLNTAISTPQNYLLTATLDPDTTRPVATINFRESADGDEAYRLTIDFNTQEISIGSKYKTYKRSCDFDPLKPLRVQLFIDGTIAECFIDDAYCFTMRIYDLTEGNLSFLSTSPELTVEKVSVKTIR